VSALACCLSLPTLAIEAFDDLLLGISYGPNPLTSIDGASSLPQDDWFCNEAVRMWGRSGRGDLRVMKQMGANLVRLYGNNPNNDHTNFLDEALAEGLGVAPGMSDWPYYQKVPGRCLDTGFDCFSQVKPLYLQNLHNGFLRADGTYHPALRYMNILNEPDLKMPSSTDIGGPEGPVQMGRTLISAFDAMLEAEKEAGVTGALINFTATFSYAICGSCPQLYNRPALGQMWTLDDAMRNPRKYGYSPKNDITAAYFARFTHSFNTQNPATDLQHQFLDDYTVHFPSTPVYIGEYHRVGANQTEDLTTILALARRNPLFKGIAFFEFQVAYWKTGSEMDFGMFGFGSKVLTHMDYFTKTYDVHCLTPQPSPADGYSMSNAVTRVYRGAGLDEEELCEINPEALPLGPSGFDQVVALKKTDQMERFVENLIHHLGGVVKPAGRNDLKFLSERVRNTAGFTFADLAEELAGTSRPSWIDFDAEHAQCVADRSAEPRVIGEAIGWACQHAKSFDCADLPASCKSGTYRKADWVFSRLYKELGEQANPLTQCSFGGAALFASSKLYNRWSDAVLCIAGGVVVPTPAPVTQVPVTQVPTASTTTRKHHDITGTGTTSTSTTSTDPLWTTTRTQKLFLGAAHRRTEMSSVLAALFILVQASALSAAVA